MRVPTHITVAENVNFVFQADCRQRGPHEWQGWKSFGGKVVAADVELRNFVAVTMVFNVPTSANQNGLVATSASGINSRLVAIRELVCQDFL